MADRHPGQSRDVLADIDITKPNIARVYDYFAGGKDNFAADREFARTAMEIAPRAPDAVRAGREFLRRVVGYLVGEAGITQLLDIGSGLPTQGNVSEVAQAVSPAARVVYVDNDPMVYIHSKALLSNAQTVEIVKADLRDPVQILTDPTVLSMIDFGRPVGLLLMAVLHHIQDEEDPGGIVARLRDAMPSGSYLAISSLRMPGPEVPGLRAATMEADKLYRNEIGSGRWREDEEILSWFGDWEMIPPGLAPVVAWRPTGPVQRDELYHGLSGGVARKG